MYFSKASFNALVSIVLVELLGISQLTDAFGLLGLADGVAVIIGPPLAGNSLCLEYFHLLYCMFTNFTFDFLLIILT